MSEDGFNSILAKCRDMIGLDASLHSVMLQSWFLHTLDFLILPSPIHVLLVIGMVLALIMFLAIKYSNQVGWDEPCSVPNRTLCCDMELHLANRPDPEGLTIDLLIEGIQINKVPADPLPPGSDLGGSNLLIETNSQVAITNLGSGPSLRILSLPKHNKGRGRPSMTDCSAEEQAQNQLSSWSECGVIQLSTGSERSPTFVFPSCPSYHTHSIFLVFRLLLITLNQILEDTTSIDQPRFVLNSTFHHLLSVGEARQEKPVLVIGLLKIYPDYCYWFIANCWISDSNYPCLLQPKYLITNRNLQLRPTDESQDYGGSMVELEILNALALGCYPILYSAKE
ncbi:hypothetical protein VNO77_42383 [Canavalia gladiata]|uniref:Uncharacterized protein n=1 Tax=Canavalia gladiata TaxID=3824 RepID=A0AAN9PS30_CANGL